MNLRWALVFSLVLILFAEARAQDAAPPVPQQEQKADTVRETAFQKFQECWDKMQHRHVSESYFNGYWQGFVRTVNLESHRDALRKMAEDGIEPKNPLPLRRVALELLGLFPKPSDKAKLRKMIRVSDSLEVDIAQILIRDGDWSSAAPVLYRDGQFEALANDPRGIPMLREAVESPDPERRLSAAQVLYKKLDQPDSLRLVARSILKMPDVKRGTEITKQVVDMLKSGATDADISAFTRVIDGDTARWSRLSAFAAIVDLAFQGNVTALSQLETLSQNCSDADIRSHAVGYVKAAKKKAQEKP